MGIIYIFTFGLFGIGWPIDLILLPPYFADFFDRSAATAYKNPLRLAKNGHFFVSDANTLTSYLQVNSNKAKNSAWLPTAR